MSKAMVAAVMLAGLLGATGARAQSGESGVRRVGPADSMFSEIVWVGDVAYLSGTMAPVDYQADPAKGTPAGYTTDTKAQAIAAIKSIAATLHREGLGLGDIVQMTAFLSGDPAKGGVMDLDGWNAAYRMYFGTAEQPNKPVRATVQVARLVLETGRIEVWSLPQGRVARTYRRQPRSSVTSRTAASLLMACPDAVFLPVTRARNLRRGQTLSRIRRAQAPRSSLRFGAQDREARAAL